jgi:hypothetical protein
MFCGAANLPAVAVDTPLHAPLTGDRLYWLLVNAMTPVRV